ncbi:MAG: hypothetical protein AAGF27_07705 [Pseudomonadota bacterium]
MLDNSKMGLDLTVQEIELIEAALHTQKKILNVQSEAGGTGASKKLTDLHRLLARIGRARAADAAPQSASWTQAAMNYLMCPGDCRAGN